MPTPHRLLSSHFFFATRALCPVPQPRLPHSTSIWPYIAFTTSHTSHARCRSPAPTPSFICIFLFRNHMHITSAILTPFGLHSKTSAQPHAFFFFTCLRRACDFCYFFLHNLSHPNAPTLAFLIAYLSRCSVTSLLFTLFFYRDSTNSLT